MCVLTELATTLVADNGGEGKSIRGTAPEDVGNCVRGKVPEDVPGSAAAASGCVGGALCNLASALVGEVKGFNGGLSVERENVLGPTESSTATGDKTWPEGDNVFGRKCLHIFAL